VYVLGGKAEDPRKGLGGASTRSIVSERLGFYLGIEIRRNRKRITLSQEQYTRQVLKRFGMSESKPVKTPAVGKVKM